MTNAKANYETTRKEIFEATDAAYAIIYMREEYSAEAFTAAIDTIDEVFARAAQMSFTQESAIRAYARVFQLAVTLAQIELTDDIKREMHYTIRQACTTMIYAR